MYTDCKTVSAHYYLSSRENEQTLSCTFTMKFKELSKFHKLKIISGKMALIYLPVLAVKCHTFPHVFNVYSYS